MKVHCTIVQEYIKRRRREYLTASLVPRPSPVFFNQDSESPEKSGRSGRLCDVMITCRHYWMTWSDKTFTSGVPSN